MTADARPCSPWLQELHLLSQAARNLAGISLDAGDRAC
jgi:hypothetical protein